jgi:hypothetical protein
MRIVTSPYKPVSARQRDDESRLAEALLADLDPDAEPEREAAECRAAIEEGRCCRWRGRPLLKKVAAVDGAEDHDARHYRRPSA